MVSLNSSYGSWMWICTIEVQHSRTIGYAWSAYMESFAAAGYKISLGGVHDSAVSGSSRNEQFPTRNTCCRGVGEGVVFQSRFPSVKARGYALQSCIEKQELGEVKQVPPNGWSPDSSVGEPFLNLAVKGKSLEDQRQVFRNLSENTVVSWTVVIHGYSQRGQGRKTLQMYKTMKLQGVQPNRNIFLSTLKACCSLADVEEGKQIHADIVEMGYGSDTRVITSLIDMYAKCGSIEDAWRVFDALPWRDVAAWTVIISGYARQVQGDKALQLYAQMQEEGISPNERTLVCALKACSSLEDKSLSLWRGRIIDAEAGRRGFESSIFVYNALVDMYVKCESIMDARAVFDGLLLRDVISWTAMMAGYVQREECEKVFQLYAQMHEEGVSPNDRTFVNVLKACGILAAMDKDISLDGHILKVGALNKVRVFHEEAVKRSFESDIFVGNTLVHVYAMCGSVVDAQLVFDMLAQRDVVSWNAMMAGYAEQEESEKVLQLYAKMQDEGVQPTETTFLSMLKGCSSAGALKMCSQIHVDIIRCGMEWSIRLTSALVHAYGKSGSMELARRLFDSVLHHDVVTWTSLIAGYARQGNCEKSVNCFQEMQQAGVKPNAITFICLLSACSHAGMVETGMQYFESMARDFGITATVEHYSCLIDLLGRAGLFKKIEKLISEMPIDPDTSVWLSLLGACRKHINVDVGRWAFKQAVSLDPTNFAAYGMMANLYACAQQWDDERDIEKLRGRAVVWKKPGQSWIELQGQVHTFRVGDHGHPPSVYAKLVELDAQM